VPDYRGRLAPTPTGEMHLGHARTFHAAWRRARDAGGALVLRIEDLDPQRCRPEYTQQMLDDFAWMGIDWTEGPAYQSQRTTVYVETWLG
jgi:glutamyl-tRNA synthetase